MRARNTGFAGGHVLSRPDAEPEEAGLEGDAAKVNVSG